jgi:hypothetical protein
MHPTPYRCIAMAIKIASDLRFAFIFVDADFIVAHNSS